jgi:hypothetical protein
MMPAFPRLPRHPHLTAALVNYYHDGDDSLGMHADDEICLGSDPLIISVSFGATRIFSLQHNKCKDNNKPIRKVFLPPRTVIVMLGMSIQCDWKHGMPKWRYLPSLPERWNLSFRYHLTQKQVDAMESICELRPPCKKRRLAAPTILAALSL